MYHLRKIKVLLSTCLLACTSLWAQDVKVPISRATADSYHNDDHQVAYAIDGNFETIWHSNWDKIPSFPVNFVITLEEVSHVDYVRYTPRLSGTNGNWKVVKVSYSTSTSGADFTSPVEYDLKGASSTFDFPIGAICGQIKFTIYPGETDNGKNLASAAEIAAYAYDTAKPAAFAQYFNGDVYSELKPGVTSSDGIADADVKALVDAMLADAEDYKKFHVGEYEPYMTTATVRNNLKTNALYNNYENPTGIYLKRGESCIIAVSGIGNYPVGLKIKDWYKSGDLSTYRLRNGLNYITATTEGNVFVDYYTDDFKIAPNVQMHFINAPVLGYWDQATMTNDDWVSMLAGPLTEDDEVIIITRSEHAQTAYPVKQWKTYCPANVDSTMTLYQQVQWAERDIMGLEKYGRQVKNRQLFYADKSGSMYAGGDASVCGYGDLRVLVTPDAKVFDFWGVGHEWGHNNQMAGFHWTGCGETTNNIPASWAQFKFTGNRDANGNPTNLRLEDEVTGINDYKGMRGGRMQTYFEEGLRKGVQWQLQDGPDWHAETPEAVTVTGRDENGKDLGQVTTTSRNYDHFVKLSPFWQLNLWGTLAERSPYIITKVLEHIRITDNYEVTYNTNGKQQVNWMKLACEAAEMDLLPFFEKAGMLRPIHAYIEDYAKGWNIITEGMINELKASVSDEVAAGRYQAYPDEEINYINGHNYHIYRDKLELNVTSMEGERNGDKVTIQHSVAQNAVAFETYNAQDELIRITMYGLGSNDTHSYTQVLFPSSFDESENAAYIMAVGYDGERQRVYQTYANEDEAKYGELGRILAGVEAMKALCNDTKVGYYKSSALTDLNAAYTTAKRVYDNKESASYAAIYDMLNAEYGKVLNDEYARVGIVEGNAYRLTNKNYPGRSLSIPTDSVNKQMMGEITDTESPYDQQLWYFEASETEGSYYLKNKNTSTYPGNVETSTFIYATATSTSDAHAYKLRDMGNGLWALEGNTALHLGAANYKYGVLGWGADATASQWYITAVEISSNAEALHDLRSLIAKTEALIAEVEGDAAYSSISTALSQTKSQVTTAKAALEAGNSSAYDALNEAYKDLLAAKKNVDDSAIGKLKDQLSEQIDETNTLINSCGTIRVVEAADLVLSTTEGEGVNFLTAGPNATPSEGNLSNLVDTDITTDFTSNWNNQSGNPYLQVTLPNGKELRKFTFTFTARQGGGAPTPSIIVVSGSNDGQNFTQIETFTKENHGFPAAASGEQWTSPEITAETAYKYLRFTVTKSERSSSGADAPNGYYHFGISHFGVSSLDEMVVTILPESGKVTEELWFSAYEAVQEAQSVVVYANTESQVQTAIEKLQAQYDALSDAKNAVQYTTFTITSNVSGGGVRYQDVDYTTTLSAPSTLTTGELIAKSVDGYVAKNITRNGTEISIVYNKVYTVTITGGEGEGRVTFGDDEYANGETFDALQNSFAAADLTAKDVTGYTKSEVTVNHETGIISVTYTLDKTALEDLIGATDDLMQECNGFVNSEFVTEELLTNTGAAITAAIEANSNMNLTYAEYTAAVTALQTAKNTLAEAKAKAEAEATERTELKAELQALVERTQSLMDNCGTVTFVEATADEEVKLQTTYPAGDGYLSANSTQSDDMSVTKLLDDDINSHYHSSWNVAAADDHYLQVYLGEGKSLVEFTFTYATRNEANLNNTSPAPTKIQVYGSSDGASFTESDLLATFTKDKDNLPAYTNAGKDWTSKSITSSATYKYLRFYVRTSDGPGNEQKDGHYFFAMSMFGLTSVGQPARYDIELAAPGVRGVTEEMLEGVYRKNASASNLLEGDPANSDLNAMIIELTTAYDELDEAYNTYVFDKSELGTLITQTRELIASCYEGETFKYTGSLYITEDLVETTTSKADEAQQVFENNVNVEQYSDALAQLKEVYANLQYAIECALFPVLLTADPASPALYIIKTKRDGDNLVLQYDEPTELFSVTTIVEKEPTQAFYFMKGEGSQVYIYPFMAGGKVLAANEVGNASGTAFAMEKGSATYEQWVFVARADGYYNLQPAGTSTYLSNIYGTSHKMGFYGSSPDTDKGSLFKFEPTTVEGSYYYLKLKDYYENQVKVASSEIQGGTAVGCYPVAEANVYNTAYSNAANVLEDATATDEEYTNAYNALKAANEALELIMPSADKFYRFVSVVKGDGSNAYVYANPEDNKMYWATDKDNSDATTIWKITPSATEGKYNISNLHTGLSINTFINYNPSPLGETAGEVSIVSLSLDGQIGIKCGDRMMHAQGGGAVVHWETGADDGSAWRIVEVDVNAVMHTATLKYEHAGLFLNYAVAKPKGVKAYYIDGTKEINIVDGVGELKLTELEGDVIPARTAVILYAPEIGNDAKTYDFCYTADDSEIDNLLTGSAYTQYLAAEADHAYYNFGQKEGQVGLYKNSVKYVYDDEQSAYVEAAEGATHYKVSANKVLFDWDASSQGVTSFRFRMGDEETGIEGITIDADATIYDLYGRRVLEVVTPGLYIVNGEKRYVKVK